MPPIESHAPVFDSHDFPARLRESLPYIIYVFDLRSVTTVYQNRSWGRELGYSDAEVEAMQGRLLEHVLHPDDQARLGALLARWETVSDRDVLEVEYRMRRADGEWRWFEARDSVFERDSGGKVVSIVGTTFDVTDRKLLQERLQQAQKLEAVGRLAGGVAHDFNNILVGILGYVELSRHDVSSPAAMLQNLDDLEKAALQAVGLTRQLLTFARQQVEIPELIEVEAHIRDVSKLLRRLLGGEVELTLALSGEACCVVIQRAALTQVLLNLVVNARDAMPAGGTLVISSAALAERGKVRVSVRDSGSGMSEEVRSHIFEPFFTTKTNEQGTGLGLSTVYGIVTQAGGTISVLSEPGQGSVFEVLLPLASAPRARE
jgi:PAS domain S-box-containing protein